PSGGLLLLFRCEGRGTAHMLSTGLGAAPAFGGAGADKIALDIGQASEYRQHQAPGAGAGVGPRFRQGSKLRLGVHDPLDDAKQIEGAASTVAAGPLWRGLGCLHLVSLTRR